MARTNRKPPPPKSERPTAKTDDPRLFIAAPLPAAVVDHLGHLLDDLSSRELPVRWSAPNALHVTLQFLGETPPERAELLRMSFAGFAPRSGPIRLRTGRLGTFPNQKRPRVLWIGLEGQTDKLTALFQKTGDMLDQYGFPIEDRSFRPHLTLGRARDNVDNIFPYQVGEVFQASSVQEIIDAPIEFAITEVVLYRSHLEKNGARYEPLSTVKL